MIKTVFFDLGNTILDYHSGNLTDEEKDIIGLWRMHGKLKEYGIEVQFEELMNAFYYPWVSSLSKRDESGKEFDIVSFLPEKIKESSGLFMELILEFHEPTARFARPIEGIREVLCEIKSRGMITGIISNSTVPGRCHDMTLKYLNLNEFIDYSFYSYDLGIRKPSGDIFRTALDKTGTLACESLMIGDRYEMDIIPAQEIGMNAIWYAKDEDLTDNNNLRRIKELNEIVSRL